MKFNLMLTGVGGEGVLTTQVIIARAANIEGYFVRGVQLHGLAQRGGTIPTFVRFGDEKEIFSPGIMEADSDLILAFEPMEGLRATYYARKDKTSFIINNSPYMPVYGNLMNLPYPEKNEILKKINQFSKKTYMFNASKIGKEKFGSTIFGNVLVVGFAVGKGLLPLKKESLRKAIKITAPRDVDLNIKAFELGLKYGEGTEKIKD